MGLDLYDERLRRLSSWMNGIPSPPLRISIFPTNVCNLQCRMCGVSHAVRAGRFTIKNELPDEEWLPFIRAGAEMGILEWWVGGGGEPLMRRELTAEIIKTIKRYSPHSEVELTTNGTRFTEEMLCDMVELGLDKMQFSIDCPDAETHDWIRRRRGTFEKATWAISRFNELKKETGKKAPWLTVNVVLNGKNYNRLHEFIPLAERIGIEHLNVTPLRVTNEMRASMEADGLVLTPEQKKKAFLCAESAKRLAMKRGIGFEFQVNKEWENISENKLGEGVACGCPIGPRDASKRRSDIPFLNLRCYETWYSLAIDAFGNPGPCVTGADGDPRYSLRDHSLHDIWYGEYFLNIRSRLTENKLIPACAHCTVTDMREKVGIALNEYVKRILPTERPA